MSIQRLLIALATTALLLNCTPAAAGSNEVQAEQIRIQSELERLTKRNAWKGVERAYQDLIALGVPVRATDHLAGEQAARIRGDINAAYERLSAALDDSNPDVQSNEPAVNDARIRKKSIENRYGRVALVVVEGRVPALVRFEWPFAREERVCIENGRTILAKNRSYEGFLPIGKYMIDGHFFEVTSDPTPLTIKVAPHGQ